ncbi:MAG: PIN domain-containing protein [Acidobacteria bacterium]|nr:PIN domain-containing protein [Acidobacteriota bacterium]MBU1339615.1 PIN domain-containing protein [Acidobacteriota bacterium]MBU1474310.1 PIN domain-containing protein [Acidobacteriota bacterium]MBU2437970.1 PIN domain-containing protein [Acidobacteriota bacterium]MBU4203361.1 PIN domain-containing protein [Acidobacteriota bacterium]
MKVFIDTSAFLAVLDKNDINHPEARAQWIKMLESGEEPVCHNYILVETSAVILRKLGIEAVRVFQRDVVPAVHVVWVTREIHEAAAGAHLLAGRRKLSLVDCVSFEIMRRTGLNMAFAFDRHFQDFGYKTTPA